MKVYELACLLDSLAQGLARVKGTTTVASDLKSFESAMRPFAERTVTDFTNFLLQCEEYQRTGIVPGKKAAQPRQGKKTADPEAVANAIIQIKSLLNEISQGQVNEQRIDEVLKPYEKLTKPQLDEMSSGLNIAGKAKSKAQVLDKIRQVVRIQVEMFEKARLIRDAGTQQ